MILSVSRRTDIPNYYSEWFFNRLREGFVYVKNPYHANQLWKVELSPDVVDCIVFWTKNPEPMLDQLDKLKQYAYYFQFTLTGYGQDIEPNLPKKQHMLTVFQALADKIGKERVVLRYDPILLTDKYTVDWHIEAFKHMAGKLNGYTERVVISFIDFYTGQTVAMQKAGIYPPDKWEMERLGKELSAIASQNGMQMVTCSEQIDLDACGITHGSCIDKLLIEQAAGCTMDLERDKTQRKECGCYDSIDIGNYDTCRNGCVYCYASRSNRQLADIIKRYQVNSPILCGEVKVEDKIAERRVKSQKNDQISLFSGGGWF